MAISQTVSASESDDLRLRVWDLHLRGVPKARIAREVGLHRNTIARYIAQDYRDVGADVKANRKRKLLAAVARMRRIQEQAWNDHDADDARERSIIEATLNGQPGGNTRYQSQRGHYLRVILDAEKEIARLEGLYEAPGEAEEPAVIFRIIREE